MTSTNSDFAALCDRIARDWCASFPKNDPSAMTSLFTPEGVYTDHAFMVTRKGRCAISKHYELWLHANPDFHVAAIEAIWPTPQGCVLKYVGKGTMTGDLAGIWKPTGKAFEFWGYCEFTVSRDEGLIERLEEVYCRDYWDSRVDGYRFEAKI